MKAQNRVPAQPRTFGRTGAAARAMARRVIASALGFALASWSSIPGPVGFLSLTPAFANPDHGRVTAATPADSGTHESAVADSSAPSQMSLRLARVSAFADSAVHVLYGPRRGDASNTLIIRIPRGTRQVPLLFDASDIPRGATVAMELRRGDGKVLARCNVKLSEFSRRRPLVVGDGARPLIPGKYSIRLAQVTGAGRPLNDSPVYAFELQHENR